MTSQDRALAGISKALEEHSLHQDKPEDYKLVQIISDNRSKSGGVLERVVLEGVGMSPVHSLKIRGPLVPVYLTAG